MLAKNANLITSYLTKRSEDGPQVDNPNPQKDRDPKPKRMDREPSGLSQDMLAGLGGARGIESAVVRDDQ